MSLANKSILSADLILQAYSSSVVVLVSADSRLAPAISLLGAQDRHVVAITPITHLFKIGTQNRVSWKDDILCIDSKQDAPHKSILQTTSGVKTTEGSPLFTSVSVFLIHEN